MRMHFPTCRATLVGILLPLAPLGVCCDRPRSTPDQPESGSSVRASRHAPSDSTLSPIDTVRRIHAYRLAGQIGRIEPYLLPEQRSAVVELIQAVDRLAWAEKVLQAAVTRHLGRASAAMFDHSDVVNIIGVFSRDVEVVAGRVDGDQALVTIQVAGRVPLEEVNMILRAKRWVIQTDAPVPGVAGQLRDLAEVLIDAARRVEKDRLTAAELKRELEAHQAPIARRLALLTRKGSSP